MAFSSGQSDPRELRARPGAARAESAPAQLVELIPAAAFLCDNAGRLTHFNGHAAALWGRRPAAGEPAGRLCGVSANPLAEWRGPAGPLATALRTGQRVRGAPAVLERPDGTRSEVCVSIEPLFGPAGGVSGALALLIESSSSTVAAEARTHLAAIVDSSDDAIISKTVDGVIRSWNRAAERLFGYTAEEAVGRPLTMLIPRERWPEEDHILERLRRGERIEHFETVRVAKDGRRLHVQLTVSPIRDASGRIIGASKIARDITGAKQTREALRASEERFRTIFETSQEGVWLIDPDARTLYVNARMAELLQSPLEALRSGSMLDFIAPEDLEATRERIGRNLAGVAEQFDLRLRRPDGAEVLLLACTSPQRDGTGRIVGALGMFSDITERRRAQVEREQLLESERCARADAERASRMKDEFLACVSHELRTPLNAMLGWAQLLRTGRLSPAEMAEGLETLEANARAQAQIVDDLLDMSRILSGKVRLEVAPVDVVQVARAALASVRPTAAAKNLHLVEEFAEPGLPVPADAARVQQVLWNLLTNAIKFTPPGGSIRVSGARTRTHVVLHVADTGIGVKADFLPFLFERFRQADGSTTRRHRGLGLGLSLVKQLVEMHGGAVWAQSDGENQGATFTVALPLTAAPIAPEEQSRRAPRSGAQAAALPSSPVLAGLVVLVVDDDPEMCALSARILREFGAEVRIAASVREAWEELEHRPPDVLVSDISMPEEDGYTLLRRVRAAAAPAIARVPAVALTAFARPEDRERALEAGYHRHLPKPVEPAELVAVVAELGREAARPAAAAQGG